MVAETQPVEPEVIQEASILDRPTHVFCPECSGIESALIEGLEYVSVCGKYVGGDIVCDKCKGIVATLFEEYHCPQ